MVQVEFGYVFAQTLPSESTDSVAVLLYVALCLLERLLSLFDLLPNLSVEAHIVTYFEEGGEVLALGYLENEVLATRAHQLLVQLQGFIEVSFNLLDIVLLLLIV